MKEKNLLAFYIITVILFMICFCYMHEMVHAEIFRSFGMDSRFELDWTSAYTIPTTNLNNCTESCILAHNITDAVGYPLFVMLGFFGIAIEFILVFILNSKKNN